MIRREKYKGVCGGRWVWGMRGTGDGGVGMYGVVLYSERIGVRDI